MASEPLPHHLPKYCVFCGAPLTYAEIRASFGERSASWNCTGCGNEDTEIWSEVDFIPGDQADQSSTDIESVPFSLNDQFTRTKGIAAIVRAAHFPLFALNDIHERFPFLSHGWGSGASPGKTLYRLSSFNLQYEGPDYPNVTERIAINQEDKEESLEFGLRAGESQIFDTGRIVRFLANLSGSAAPDMLALWQGMAIYQYVNIEAARRTPVIQASIQTQSGEVISWKIRRFNAPLPIVYAQAQVENTIIEVGAIGPAAEEIENLLGHLTRLTPESAVLDQINAGIKAWAEYLQRYYQNLLSAGKE